MQDSAFKPFKKCPTDDTELQQTPENESGQESSSSSSPVSVTTCSPSTSLQVKPYDYSVEKLLKSSPPSVSSSVPSAPACEEMRPDSCHPSLVEMSKWSSVPLSLIARHLWWHSQRTFAATSTEVASREVTSTAASSSMCESRVSNDTLCFRTSSRKGS